jgi:hypothetical protein
MDAAYLLIIGELGDEGSCCRVASLVQADNFNCKIHSALACVGRPFCLRHGILAGLC